jgi:hypothetical protein
MLTGRHNYSVIRFRSKKGRTRPLKLYAAGPVMTRRGVKSGNNGDHSKVVLVIKIAMPKKQTRTNYSNPDRTTLTINVRPTSSAPHDRVA